MQQMTQKKFLTLLRAFRVNQWVKNLVVFTAIVFSGKLFDINFFWHTFAAFIIFCLLSSTSYLLNDIIDYPYDRKHPVKKNRPIASGEISIPEATFYVFIMIFISLVASLFFSVPFFFLSLIFIALHFLYSLHLKRFPVIDIFAISFSFMLRTLAGEVATGFHIPIWLLFTIFFGSLFIATVKRHAELVAHHGEQTRESLDSYQGHLLDFLTNTFATGTILAYAFYTYIEQPLIGGSLGGLLTQYLPHFEARRWLMITIPLVVYAISRYAQLLYQHSEGERPERIITTDKPLIITMAIWGLMIIALIYVL